MLVLSRFKDQSVIIGDDIAVTVVKILGDKIRLGINAPLDVPVHRDEVYDNILRSRGETPGQPLIPRTGRDVLADQLRKIIADRDIIMTDRQARVIHQAAEALDRIALSRRRVH